MWALYIINLLMPLGYAWFGLHPERLQFLLKPEEIPTWLHHLNQAGAQIQIVMALTVWIFYFRKHPTKNIFKTMAWLYAIALSCELIGTSTGLLFGPYHFTDLLGPKWFGKVPFFIPIVWSYTALVTYRLALFVFPEKKKTRLLFMAMLMLILDLSTDPAMSHQITYWVWEKPGVYYGVPLTNYIGWLIVSLTMGVFLEKSEIGHQLQQQPVSFFIHFYNAINIAPLGLVLAGQLGLAFSLTLVSLLIVNCIFIFKK